MFHNNGEDLVENVVHLRNKLKVTESSLQTLGQQLSERNTNYLESSPQHGFSDRLTIEDLEQPDATEPPPNDPCFTTPTIRMAERRTCDSAPHADSRPPSTKEMETENSRLRRQLNTIREENSSLVLENRQLMNELEALQFDLASSKSKIRLLGSTVGSKASSLSDLKEQILSLEAEVESHANALRDTEQSLRESQQSSVLSSRLAEKLKEELRAVKAELADRNSQAKRTEQQRNEALYNAEKLTAAFKDYKGNVSEKLRKLLENEILLKESLSQCERERAEFESKFSEWERERADARRLIQQLQEESRKTQTTSAENADLHARLERSSQDISRLERELAERQGVERELEALRRVSGAQEQRMAQCQHEAAENRAQLTGLEAILALLHLREGGGLCTKPCMLPPSSNDLFSNKPGEGYQKLLAALQALEQEKNRQTSLVSALQERLSKAQEEISALQDSMAQRTSHFQQIHNELLEKATGSTCLERELKKKSTRMAALEKQLEAKTAACSKFAMKNCELEQDLLEKGKSIQHLQSILGKKQKDYQQALQKSKQASSQQFKQLEDQTELLQLSLEQKQAQLMELEQVVSQAQRERQEARHHADLLQATLTQLTQEEEMKAKRSDEALQNFEEQSAKSCEKVKYLETALSLCKDELGIYLQQMGETKKQFEEQLKIKSIEVENLQVELRSNALGTKTSSEHLLQLKYSLKRQQAMLQESNARVSELEDSQAQLQQQVAGLEKERERERATLAQELQRWEQMAMVASQEAQNSKRRATELSGSVTQLTTEMNKCRGELTDMEVELLQLRRDSRAKASQLSQMEENLQETQGLLEKKAEMVVDLEEKLHRSEMDRRNSLQRAQLLEGQLQTVRGELTDTLSHLQELRDVLQRTQLTAEEREAAMEKLAAELRESKRELEERNHEILDMDTALKERQGELHHRALQLSQLDVAIRDHRIELEKKVLHLQEGLAKSEQEVKERDQQVEFLSEQLELVRTQLHGKESFEKDALDQGQQLRLCREQLQRTANELLESRSRCEALSRELSEGALLLHQKEAQVKQLAQDLAATEAAAAQVEDQLQASITSLQKELEQQRTEHHVEIVIQLSAMQQSRTQLLKVSDHISCSLRSSHEQLAEQLQNFRAQLDEAQGNIANLQAQLRSREQLLQGANEALLIKESEVTRLQTKISSYERTAELHSTSLCREPARQTLSPNPTDTLRSTNWTHDDSLYLSHCLKDSLQATLQPSDQSWQGLSQHESTSSEFSFNPLTYMAGEDVGPDSSSCQPHQEPELETLTGMLRFVNERLALEDDSTLWRSTAGSIPESICEEQRDPKDDCYSARDL